MSTELKETAILGTKSSGNLKKPSKEVFIGGSEIDVIYKPALSAAFILAIKEHIPASMSSSDESSHQYELKQIIEDFNYPELANGAMTETDKDIIVACNECYDYIEL